MGYQGPCHTNLGQGALCPQQCCAKLCQDVRCPQRCIVQNLLPSSQAALALPGRGGISSHPYYIHTYYIHTTLIHTTSILHPYYTHPYYIHTTLIHTKSILHPSILHPSILHPYYTHPYYIHTTSILHPSILYPYYTHPYYIHTTSILHPSILHPYYTHPYCTHLYYTHTTPLQTALHKSSICILSRFQCMQFSLYKKMIKSNDNDQWKMTSTKGGSVQSKCELVLFGCPCVVLMFKIDRSYRTSYIVPSCKYRLVAMYCL